MSYPGANTRTEIKGAPPSEPPLAKPPEIADHLPEQQQNQTNLGNAGVASAVTSGSPAEPTSSSQFHAHLGNAAVARMLIQRKPKDEAQSPVVVADATSPPATPAEKPPAIPAHVTAPSPLIVEDTAALEAGQMKKSDFLAQLLANIKNAAAEGMAGTPRFESASNYIDGWFANYSKQSGQQLEQAIRKYAPEGAATYNARALVYVVTERVRRSITTWKTTGQITGLPEGLAQSLPGAKAGGFSAAMGQAMTGAAATIGRGMSSIGNIFRKAEGGPAEVAGHPDEIQSQLGPGHSLDAGIKEQMESAYGASFSGVRVHTDSDASSLSDDLSARAFTIGDHIAFGRGEYQPGTVIGDALIAHELAHVAQQRGSGSAALPAAKGGSEYTSLEDDADTAAVGAVASVWGKTKAGLSTLARNAKPNLKSGLRLQRCDVAKAPTDLKTAEQKANWIKQAIADDKSLTSRAIVDVFKTSESASEFLSIQKYLDMEAVLEYLSDFDAIIVGTLGPVLGGQAALNKKRAEYVVTATHDYGVDRAQVFIHFIFATMHTDDMREVLKLLAEEKRLAQTILMMDAVKTIIAERGIKPSEYEDRSAGLSDAARGVGQFLWDFLNSSPAAQSGTGSAYFSQGQRLPEEYSKLLNEIDQKLMEEAMSPGNVALGTADYLTFNVVGGAVGLVKGTVQGGWDLAHGKIEEGAYQLTGAAMVLGTYLGVKAYQKMGGPKTVMGPEGPGQFVIKGFEGPIPKDVARLGSILALNPEAQAMSGLLISRIGKDGMVKVAGYVQADSKAAILVHERGLPAVEALFKAEGDVARARGMLPPKPAGLLPAVTETSLAEAEAARKLAERTAEPQPKPEPKPEPKPKSEPKPAPKAEPKVETPPPLNDQGKYDLSGRTGKDLVRDSNSTPYPGETVAQAEARVAQALQEARSRLPGLKPCFVSGTPVLTPDGPIAIEELQPGGQVMAMDPEVPDTLCAARILEVLRGGATELVHLSIDGEPVTTTRNHRFFVLGSGWVQARDLSPGDLLVTPDGKIAVQKIENQQFPETRATFNLHIANQSTFLVGLKDYVLVHNSDPDFNRTLWWLFGEKAGFRPTDTDGVSMWKTESAEDVNDFFKVRKSIYGQGSNSKHSSFTPEELAANGIKIDPTPGHGPLAGRLQHGSARPTGAPAGDLDNAAIKEAVDGINKTAVAVKATPKSVGC